MYIILTWQFLIYSDSFLEQFTLSISAGNSKWVIATIGWEIAPAIWPLLVITMVDSIGLTLFGRYAAFAESITGPNQIDRHRIEYFDS